MGARILQNKCREDAENKSGPEADGKPPANAAVTKANLVFV